MKRRALLGVVLLALLGSSGCGSDDREADASGRATPVCRRLGAAFADSSRAGPDPMDEERLQRAVMSALGQFGPLRGWGGTSLPGHTGSLSKEDVEAVSRWFLVECVGPTVVEGPEDRRLLPRHPPTRVPLCLAMDTAELAAIGLFPRPEPPGGHSALWGDAARPDPWSGTVVSLTTVPSDRVPVHDGAAPARVGDRSALVAPAPLFQAVSSSAWGHVVSWQERPALVAEVALRGGSPSDVVRMAEQVRFDGDRPVLPADALGARTEVLFDGALPSPLGLFAGLWSAHYGAGERSFQVLGHRSVGGALQALAYWSVHAERVTINHHGATLYAAFDAERGPWGAIWEEGDGLTIQVVGFASRDEVVRFASSLEDVSPAAWRVAKAQSHDCHD